MEKEHEAELTHSIPLQICKFRYICNFYYPIPLKAHSWQLIEQPFEHDAVLMNNLMACNIMHMTYKVALQKLGIYDYNLQHSQISNVAWISRFLTNWNSDFDYASWFSTTILPEVMTEAL